MNASQGIRTALVIAALFALAAQARAGGTAQLVLRLHDSQGHAATYRATVDAARFTDGAAPSPTELADHLTRAKSRMADELGYTERLHGRDHYKVLGAVRVAGAWVEKDGRRTPLGFFRSEPTE